MRSFRKLSRFRNFFFFWGSLHLKTISSPAFSVHVFFPPKLLSALFSVVHEACPQRFPIGSAARLYNQCHGCLEQSPQLLNRLALWRPGLFWLQAIRFFQKLSRPPPFPFPPSPVLTPVSSTHFPCSFSRTTDVGDPVKILSAPLRPREKGL